MAQHWPSIQSFFQPDGTKSRKIDRGACGDGFTAEEIDAVVNPSPKSWKPKGEYSQQNIGDLTPGPGRVSFTGRVVNLFEMQTASKMPEAAKGVIKIILKDDTGAVIIKLWFANATYSLCLGQLCTVHATYIAHIDVTTRLTSVAPLLTSIFPQRDSTCNILLQEDTDESPLCRKPLGHSEGQPLEGLMTLQNFIGGGHEIEGSKILACVKSIGARKKFTNKNGNVSEKVDVGLFDDTAEASITLWGSIGASVVAWCPSQTVLLLTSPGIKVERRAWLSLTSSTHVDVDPVMKDADWLRKVAQSLTKRESCNPPVPEGVFDVEAVLTSQVRTLYTLADIDEFTRSAPGEKCAGFLSVIVMELNLLTQFRRNRLLCIECCGLPIYSNHSPTTCPNCDNPTFPTLNPKIVGTLIDETGCIAPGKSIWTAGAWEQLLGRTAGELSGMDVQEVRKLEERVLFGRVTLVFGWDGGEEGPQGAGGRLVVLGVKA